MKKMTLVMVTGLLTLLCAKPAVAQNLNDIRKMSATQKAQLIADSLKPVLKLSVAQYNKVYTTALEGILRAVPVMQSGASKFSKGLKLRPILDDTEDKLKLILSAAQFAAYKSTKEKTIAYCRQQIDEGRFHL